MVCFQLEVFNRELDVHYILFFCRYDSGIRRDNWAISITKYQTKDVSWPGGKTNTRVSRNKGNWFQWLNFSGIQMQLFVSGDILDIFGFWLRVAKGTHILVPERLYSWHLTIEGETHILAPETRYINLFQLQWPYFHFWKKHAFSSPIFSSWDTNFAKNCSRDLSFKQKSHKKFWKCFWDHTFKNLGGTYLLKRGIWG